MTMTMTEVNSIVDAQLPCDVDDEWDLQDPRMSSVLHEAVKAFLGETDAKDLANDAAKCNTVMKDTMLPNATFRL